MVAVVLQEAIREDAHGWILETMNTAYALGLNRHGHLAHRYWGPRLPAGSGYPPSPAPVAWASFNGPTGRTPLEYPVYGGLDYSDPCLKVTFADGVRDTVLQFDHAEVRQDGLPELRIRLRDAHYPLVVTLWYRVHVAYDLIERWVTVEQQGETPVTLERVFSAQWQPPAEGRYRFTHLTGRWSDEFHLVRETLTEGIKTIESRRLTTSHQHAPWFALDDGTAQEESGSVYFGTLAWSGNWRIGAEVSEPDLTRITIGVNDWDFAWRLQPGAVFTAPSAFAGYSAHGFGGAGRALHAFIRDCIVPHPEIRHPVLYNSWEATTFAVDVPSQVELARRAAAMGVELFVMDDGWFHRRNDDRAGLGDWWPDEHKFPEGLEPLISEVTRLGMEFGLWVEPEMVNPDSDLYRAHPDWVIHFPTRERTTARQQLILNLARDDVQSYLITALDTLLTRYPIRFIKWDMNRNVSEPGWPEAPGDPRELWVRYVQGLYRVWGTLRERHPAVVWQSCSGGGGRADLGILQLADQIWVSDNTEATARLQIQEGFSHVFPACTMESWVTDVAREQLSLEFRFHVAMCGVLGVGGDLLRWSEEQRDQAAVLIARYKEVRHVIQQGDLYRLISPAASPVSALLYVGKDRAEAVLFAFRTHLPFPPRLPVIHLHGLDQQARYAIEGVPDVSTGAGWHRHGLTLDLADFSATMRVIRRVDTSR